MQEKNHYKCYSWKGKYFNTNFWSSSLECSERIRNFQSSSLECSERSGNFGSSSLECGERSRNFWSLNLECSEWIRNFWSSSLECSALSRCFFWYNSQDRQYYYRHRGEARCNKKTCMSIIIEGGSAAPPRLAAKAWTSPKQTSHTWYENEKQEQISGSWGTNLLCHS